MITQLILFILLSLSSIGIDNDEIKLMLEAVNIVRSEGCRCGGKNMPPVPKVRWNHTLQNSAAAHAEDMNKNNYFSHYSLKGEDVGKRVDFFHYKWLVIGENIAEGQSDFYEVLKDWLKSPSHCRMIMDAKVDEMGIGRSGKYWVQHFGKQKEKHED